MQESYEKHLLLRHDIPTVYYYYLQLDFVHFLNK